MRLLKVYDAGLIRALLPTVLNIVHLSRRARCLHLIGFSLRHFVKKVTFWLLSRKINMQRHVIKRNTETRRKTSCPFWEEVFPVEKIHSDIQHRQWGSLSVTIALIALKEDLSGDMRVRGRQWRRQLKILELCSSYHSATPVKSIVLKNQRTDSWHA